MPRAVQHLEWCLVRGGATWRNRSPRHSQPAEDEDPNRSCRSVGHRHVVVRDCSGTRHLEADRLLPLAQARCSSDAGAGSEVRLDRRPRLLRSWSFGRRVSREVRIRTRRVGRGRRSRRHPTETECRADRCRAGRREASKPSPRKGSAVCCGAQAGMLRGVRANGVAGGTHLARASSRKRRRRGQPTDQPEAALSELPQSDRYLGRSEQGEAGVMIRTRPGRPPAAAGLDRAAGGADGLRPARRTGRHGQIQSDPAQLVAIHQLGGARHRGPRPGRSAGAA